VAITTQLLLLTDEHTVVTAKPAAAALLYRCQSRPIQVPPDSLLHTHQSAEPRRVLFCFVFVSAGMGGEELSQLLSALLLQLHHTAVLLSKTDCNSIAAVEPVLYHYPHPGHCPTGCIMELFNHSLAHR